MTVIDWLLDSDPSIRWQVMRDLTHEPADVIAAERSRVATEGWGARLLALQAPDGLWGGAPFSTSQFQPPSGSCSPRSRSTSSVISTPKYEPVETTFPLMHGSTSPSKIENGATVSSFGTTINVLEGLLEHQRAIGGSAVLAEARRRGEEYMLERRLFRRKSTGEVIDPSWLQFSFPTWYFYDVLRGLEYLRDAGVEPEERIAEAIGVVEGNRDPDGRWPLQNVHDGEAHFEMDDGEGRPSRWNTLRALRVLHWFAQAPFEGPSVRATSTSRARANAVSRPRGGTGPTGRASRD